jgi:hypothetical protein
VDASIEALHCAARRYCEERYRHWALLHGADAPPAPADLAARYQQLDAILEAVERFVPGDFATLEEARELLVVAGESARAPSPGGAGPATGRAAEE